MPNSVAGRVQKYLSQRFAVKSNHNTVSTPARLAQEILSEENPASVVRVA
jgi:hypothetical protein